MEDENEVIETAENEIDASDPDHLPGEESGSEGDEEYQPNLKFKVDEKEFEFDERVKGLITDKESEEYFRDIYTKAYGLDLVKQRQAEKDQKFQQRELEYNQLQSQSQNMETTFKKLAGLKDQDFGTFQKAWQIPDNAILARASEILSVHGKPEDQARLDQVYTDRLKMLQYEDQVNNGFQQQQAMRMQFHEMKMQSVMSQPEVSSFASRYDQLMGQPGAFQEEVNRIGSLEFHTTKGYLDPQVAVAKAQQRLSKLMPPETTPQQKAPVSKEKTAPAAAPLPNMGTGRSGTVTKKKLTSTDDLRKLAAMSRR